MKKNNLMSYLSLGIVFVLFNVIAFVVPTDKTATFWTAYAFSVVAFAVFMIFPILPVWLAIVVCAIILVISALCAIAGQAGANEINRVEEKIKVKRAFIQFLQTDIEMLAESESDAEIKAALSKLAEKVRFSDPMSHEMLGELESRITAKVEEMKTTADKKALIEEVTTLLTERNKKSKILK